MTDYKDFYFEVRDKRGRLQATFTRRYEAEKYAETLEESTITKIEIK